MEKRKVIFRRWFDGSIIALFPETPSDQYGHSCLSYEEIGQHGSASIDTVMIMTTPLKEEEQNPLIPILTKRGYDLQIVYKQSKKMQQTRREAAKEKQTPFPNPSN